MIRTLFFFGTFAVTLGIYTPKLIILKSLKEKLPPQDFAIIVEEYTSKWASTLMKVSGAKVHVSGLEHIPKDEPVLFVSNHQSNFDTALFMSYIRKPKGFIAKKELAKIPMLPIWMGHLRCVLMDRTDMKKQLQSILEGIQILKDGHSMVVFPEGTRSQSNEMAEFKPGSFKLATKTKVPIVPVTICGSYKLMEQNNNRIKPADVYITVHPIVCTKDLSQDELTQLPKNVFDTIKSALRD